MAPSYLFGGSTPQERDAREAKCQAWRRQNADALQRAAEAMKNAKTTENEQSDG